MICGLLRQHKTASKRMLHHSYVNFPLRKFPIYFVIGLAFLLNSCAEEEDPDDIESLWYEKYLLKVENPDDFVIIEPPHFVPNSQSYPYDYNLRHNSWCHDMVLYDEENDIINLFYSSASGHGISGIYGVLMFKQRTANGEWSAPVLVGDEPDYNNFYYSSCCTYDNGKYIILAKNNVFDDRPLIKLTSTDLISWNKQYVYQTDSDFLRGDGPCCLTKLSNERWIFFLRSVENGSEKPYVCYSDDDMNSWTKVPLEGLVPNFYYPSEGDFYVCEDGEILLIVREGDTPGTRRYPLLFISLDNGQTWSFKKELVEMDCYSSPVQFLKDEKRNKVVLFYNSRWLVNGMKNVHYMVTTEEMLKSGQLFGEKTIAGHMADADIGYCSAVIDKKGLIHLFWYAGSSVKSYILTTILQWKDEVSTNNATRCLQLIDAEGLYKNQ